MKKLLLSTVVLSGWAYAASAQDTFRSEADALELRASDLIGMRIYASEAAVEVDETDGMQEDWEDVGEVNDIVLSRDGAAQAVLVDIGGFLGMGERQVAVTMDSLRFVSDGATADEASDFFLVMTASRADLEAAPDYGMVGVAAGAVATTATVAAVEGTGMAESAVEETGDAVAAVGTEVTGEASDPVEGTTEEVAQADMTDGGENAVEAADATGENVEAAAETGAAMAGVEDEALATEEAAVEDAATRTAITREGYVAATGEDLTADRLQGAAVYDSTDERVGEISELLLSDDGQITEVVVDVGGFLGIGEKPVALDMNEVDILRQDGGDEVRVYLSQTREVLDAMDSYVVE